MACFDYHNCPSVLFCSQKGLLAGVASHDLVSDHGVNVSQESASFLTKYYDSVSGPREDPCSLLSRIKEDIITINHY